ncbi:hypothetical protein PG997_012146 [Apiospora hydei]|uniref:F-box domain-containing protein n=1 Tax=Apiospora hydei TaxID=1337664 RepID=A0ABR1V2H5_9PEZI
MTPPKLESLANELKVMILKEMDAASILSLISASPTYHRIFYTYYSEILEHSVLVSSDVLPEVLNDALAAASLPYPFDLNAVDHETINDYAAAEKAVRYSKERKFAFAPAAPSRPSTVLVGCTVPGYPNNRFLLCHGVTLARLGSCIKDFIDDYAEKARCDPLKDFYIYNNTPEWAHQTLKPKRKTSPIGPNRHLSKDEHVKFQRAFFRFEFYARVHAHLESAGEFHGRNNPLIQLAPSETEEVACVYGYLYSLQMLAVDEIQLDDRIKKQCAKPQTYPVQHFSHGPGIPRLDAELLLRAKLASGIKRVWDSVVSPFNKRSELVYEDIARRLHSEMDRYRGLTFGNDHDGFMRGVLNGDPRCCLRRCCNHQWGIAHRIRVDSRLTSPRDAMPIVRFDEGSSEGASCRMCPGASGLRRYRMTDFKVVDFNGFLVEKDDGSNDGSNSVGNDGSGGGSNGDSNGGSNGGDKE